MAFDITQFEMEPQQLIDALDKKVVKQDDAKEALSVAVCNHYHRLKFQESMGENPDVSKTTPLLVGSTGVGKTYMARQIAKAIGVPFNYADATDLSETGYVGKDVDTVVTELMMSYSMDEAQYGMVFIDEFDKLARRGNILGQDVSRDGVQRGLLTLLEGKMVSPVSSHSEYYHRVKKMDTRNIFFILAGAFDGIYELIHEEKRKDNRIGFGSDAVSKDEIEEQIRSGKLKPTPDILEKYGFMNQITGRISGICFLDNLDRDDLYSILKLEKNPAVLSKSLEFQARGIDLVIEDDAYRAMADNAYSRKKGARSLKSVLDEALAPYQRHFDRIKGCGTFVLTEKMVLKPGHSLEDYVISVIPEREEDAPSRIWAREEYISHLAYERFSQNFVDSAADYGIKNNLEPEELRSEVRERFEELKDYEDYFKGKFGPDLKFEDSAAEYLVQQSLEKERDIGAIIHTRIGSYIEKKDLWAGKGDEDILITKGILLSPRDHLPALRKEYKG